MHALSQRTHAVQRGHGVGRGELIGGIAGRRSCRLGRGRARLGPGGASRRRDPAVGHLPVPRPARPGRPAWPGPAGLAVRHGQIAQSHDARDIRRHRGRDARRRRVRVRHPAAGKPVARQRRPERPLDGGGRPAHRDGQPVGRDRPGRQALRAQCVLHRGHFGQRRAEPGAELAAPQEVAEQRRGPVRDAGDEGAQRLRIGHLEGDLQADHLTGGHGSEANCGPRQPRHRRRAQRPVTRPRGNPAPAKAPPARARWPAPGAPSRPPTGTARQAPSGISRLPLIARICDARHRNLEHAPAG